MRLRFGDFLLDTELRVLLCNGAELTLEPKVFDCLELLASAPAKLTTAAQLRAALWPDIHVANGALRRIINEARKALGDTGREQRFIRTRRSLGYVFLPEVRDESRRVTADASSEWPFVGRARELELVRQWLTQEQGGLCFVSAEAGAGKSTLLAQLALQYAAEEGRWLFAGCQATLGTPAFWPFRELGTRLCADPILRVPARRLAAQVPQVLELLPALAGEHGSAHTVPVASVEARFELCEALANFWRALSRRCPLYLVIEDLHWADDGSIVMLEALARAAREERLYLFATYRPESVVEGSALGQLIGRTSGRANSLSMHLEPLGLAALQALLERVSLPHSPSNTAAALLQLTGGNALYVRELLRHVIVNATRLDAASPPSLQHIIAERIGLLPETSRERLAQAAVLGNDFSLALLAAVAGTSREALELTLLPLLRSGLLRHCALRADGLRFGHALVREALLQQLSPQQRRMLHGAVLRSLLAQAPGSASSAELAVHAFEAGDLVAAQERRRLCEQAGDEAFAALAFDRAALHYGRALQLLPADDDSTPAAALAFACARARWHADESEREVEAAFLQAAKRARRAHAPDLFAEAAIGYALGDHSNTLMRIASLRPMAQELAEEAWSLLTGDPERDASSWPNAVAYRLAATLCWLRVEAGELADIAFAAQRACRLAPAQLEPVQTLWLLALRSAAEPERANELIDALQARVLDSRLTAWRRIELCAAIMSARLTLGQRAGWEQAAGEIARAAALLPEPALSGRAGERATIYMTLPLSVEVTRAVMQGRLADAEQQFFAVARHIQQLGLKRSREGDHDGFHMLLQLYGYLGRSRELEPFVDSQLERDPKTRWFASLLKAQFALERADCAAALEHFASLRVTGFRPTLDGRLLLAKPETLLRAAAVCLEVGSAADAELLYDALRSRAAHCIQDGALICWGSCARPLAALAFRLGRLEDAERHFLAALALNQRLDHRPELIHTQLGFARLLLATGREPQARPLLARAERAAAESGMAPAVALARSLATG